MVPPEEFLKYAGRHCGVPVTSLFEQGDEDDGVSEYLDYCQKRVAPVKHVDLDFEHIMLPSQKIRLQEYAVKYKLLSEDGGHFVRHAVVDLDHSPHVRPKICFDPDLLGSKMYCRTSHGFHWHTRLRKPLLTLQLATGHVIAPSPGYVPGQTCTMDWRYLLNCRKISYGSARSLIGLGWHEGVIGSWVMFLLGSIEQRALFEEGPRSMPQENSCEAAVLEDDDIDTLLTPSKPSNKRRRMDSPPSASSLSGFQGELMAIEVSDGE